MAFEEERSAKEIKGVSEAYPMAVQEIWMRCVNIASLHCDHVGHKFRCWCHRVLEEIDDDAIEALAQRRIPTECLLTTYERNLKTEDTYYQRTYDFL